jgi:hypothetical protein
MWRGAPAPEGLRQPYQAHFRQPFVAYPPLPRTGRATLPSDTPEDRTKNHLVKFSKNQPGFLLEEGIQDFRVKEFGVPIRVPQFDEYPDFSRPFYQRERKFGWAD